MNYGFLIRNDRCIGCHACSTACKSENEVPLGVNRTWVKTVEKGVYPDVRRHFQVTRCNHCANPPCVRICPVTAMYQRADGVVEFDGDQCIGCKACLQACPYDAIYIDPDTGTAAKCHLCAHRLDLDLEPACVVVCPEHAIVSGDLDDPGSEISRMLAAHQVTVRKPEQGTAPKLFYVDGEETALVPTATERAPGSFAWADVLPLHAGGHHAPAAAGGALRPSARARGSARNGAPLRAPEPQGLPVAGPIHIGEGRFAGEMVRNVYNAQHRIPWHWPVPAYLVTKGMAAGSFLLLALAWFGGLRPLPTRDLLWVGILSLVFVSATTALLVLDLERPERFLRVLTRPQWRSWLTRGAVLLVAFSTLVGAWWVLELAGSLGFAGPLVVSWTRLFAFGLGVPLALGVAVYTAFLFGQAEGRDLWQSPLLPLHLLVQAAAAGGALLLVAGVPLGFGAPLLTLAAWTLAAAIVVDLALVLPGELAMPHASADAARAAHDIVRGRYRSRFWLGGVIAGHLVPLALLAPGTAGWPGALAGALALAGLYAYEYAYVMAPQEIPNS